MEHPGHVLTTDGAGNFTFQAGGDTVGNFTFTGSVIDTDDPKRNYYYTPVTISSDLNVENNLVVTNTVSTNFVSTAVGTTNKFQGYANGAWVDLH